MEAFELRGHGTFIDIFLGAKDQEALQGMVQL
jgi:hypothetical protein